MKVLIEVDPHKASVAVAALDEAKGEFIERAGFPQDRAGLRCLERWVKRFPERRPKRWRTPAALRSAPRPASAGGWLRRCCATGSRWLGIARPTTPCTWSLYAGPGRTPRAAATTARRSRRASPARRRCGASRGASPTLSSGASWRTRKRLRAALLDKEEPRIPRMRTSPFTHSRKFVCNIPHKESSVWRPNLVRIDRVAAAPWRDDLVRERPLVFRNSSNHRRGPPSPANRRSYPRARVDGHHASPSRASAARTPGDGRDLTLDGGCF